MRARGQGRWQTGRSRFRQRRLPSTGRRRRFHPILTWRCGPQCLGKARSIWGGCRRGKRADRERAARTFRASGKRCASSAGCGNLSESQAKTMNHSTMRAALALFVSLLLPATALGRQAATRPATQPTTNPTTPTTSPWASPAFNREMTVSPAKAEDAVPPSERADPFAFSQDALELRHENAATLYLQAFNFRGPTPDEVERVEEIPLLEVNPAEVRRSFGELYSGPERRPFEIAEPAVRRTMADWGAPVNEKGIEAQLPYLSEARTFARLMAMEARLLAREGRYEESADMLRRLFVLGQHLGNSREPVLVDGLVGVGVSALALDRAAQISQLPDAPNRYWALTTLPAPMFDINRWMRSERIFLTVSLPALRDPEHITSAEYFDTLRKLRTYMSDNDSGASSLGQLLEDTAATAQLAAQAGPYLKARGYTDEQLKSMGMHAV